MPRDVRVQTDPKYFEQAISDYSDVVQGLQKLYPGYNRHGFFCVATTFVSSKKKG